MCFFIFLSISGDTLQGYLCGVEKELSFLPYLVGRKVEEDCCSCCPSPMKLLLCFSRMSTTRCIALEPRCIVLYPLFWVSYSKVLGVVLSTDI